MTKQVTTTPTLTVRLEETAHLNADDAIVARLMSRFVASEKLTTLDEVEKKFRFYFSGFFIYRGGSHIAVHRVSGDSRRVLFIGEGR